MTHRISAVSLFLLTGRRRCGTPARCIIETISGPLIAAILFILPMYAVRAVPAMRKYRAASNVFVLVMGLIALSALIYGFGVILMARRFPARLFIRVTHPFVINRRHAGRYL